MRIGHGLGTGRFRKSARRGGRVAVALAGVAAVFGALVAQAVPAAAYGGELVIIDKVIVGSPVTSTYSSCAGWVDQGGIVIPVTVVATFIPPPGDEPIGPYATASWSGGFGSWDDHFGTDAAKDTTQYFHILLRPDAFGDYHGQGTYYVSVLAQDVGLAGGIGTKDNIKFEIPPPPPSHATAKVKCTPAKPFNIGEQLGDLAKTAAEKLGEEFCGVCFKAKDLFSNAQMYSEILDHYFGNVAKKDPPDANYQQIAQPNPPPVLPAPATLSTDQQLALTNLEQGLAQNIGLMRALLTSFDRVWGADNAGQTYWHHRQLQAVSSYASQSADALASLQQLYDDYQAVVAPGLPQFTVSESDASQHLATLLHGLPSEDAAVATQLGESPASQHEMADDLLLVDPTLLPTSDGVGALFGQNFADFVQPMRLLANWAASTASYDPPVVTSVTPDHLSSTGGEQVTVSGTNLQDVTGLNFGPSSTAGGQARDVYCNETQCYGKAPPGAGTVDVVAIGPGGPSEVTPADRVTYDAPATPQVDRIFPASGAVGGNNFHPISVFGSGLAHGSVYFGPALATEWGCNDTMCTAYPPPSASTGTVDVTVAGPGGSSPPVADDEYTYLASAPPPPPAPVVTGVAPAHGPRLGGDTITITGSNFTNATEVDFGSGWDSRKAQSYKVLDDSHIEAVTAGGDSGPVDVIVYSNAGASAANPPGDQYTYDPATAPVITGISPDTGPDIGGTKLTISGTDLGDENSSVTVGDNWVGDSVCTETQCTATAPPGADGTVDVTVQTPDGTSAPSTATAFTYTHGPDPVITKITPQSGTVDGGTAVAIYGTNLNSGSVSFGGIPTGDWNPCTATACVVTAPPHAAGTVDITVTTQAGTSATAPADEFSYVKLPIPTVRSISPNSGWLVGDTDVQIFGTNLTNGKVYFGNQPAWSTECTSTVCTAKSPDSDTLGPVHLTVQTPSGTSLTSSADEFSYIQPEITGVSPASGPTTGGNKVTITGTNLVDDQFPDDDYVEFGTDAAAQLSCVSDTKCVATAPQHAAGTVDLRVQPFIVKSPITAADHYTFVTPAAPVVTSISPTSGTHGGGDQVTVTGANLDGGTVKFGGYGANGTCTDTSCTVVSPGHADGPVDVTVTTQHGGTSATGSADVFTFQPPGVPTVTGVSPATGSTAGGTTVTVTGTNLTKGSVAFGTTAPTNVTCYATTCTVTAPKHATGAVDVFVTTAAGKSAASPADTYTYATPPAPTVTDVSPETGPRSGGTRVTVTGTDLYGGVVHFGAQGVTGWTCTQTSCTGLAPAGTAGDTDVTVTTDGGMSATSAADVFTYGRLSLTEHPVTGVTAKMGGGGITPGIGGALWFTIPNLDKIGRIAPDGTTQTYVAPGTSGTVHPNPWGITEGPDGRMWYTERQTNTIVAVDGSGNQTSYPVPGDPDNLRFITSGPDGRLWFTLGLDGAIGAMTTSGDITLFKMPDPYVVPYSIITGPDGRLWFTEVNGDSIGAITTSGVISEYPLPDANAMAWGISRGPDNRIWFAEENNRAIGAVTVHGAVSMYPLPDNDYDPEGLTYGADGRMWFAAIDNSTISALDPATGDVVDYPLPTGSSGQQLRFVVSDASGTLWATEFGGAKVVSVDGVTAAVPPTVSAVSSEYGAAGDTVTITGTNLGGATAVTFGGVPAGGVTVVDPGHVQATVPAGSGTVPVEVTTPNGTSADNPAAAFHYGAAPTPAPAVTGVAPDSGLVAGGDSVTVTGTDLAGGTVTVGSTAATGVSCTATSCTATVPAGAAGTVDVTVTTAGGTSAVSDADHYTYLDPPPPVPTITSVSPATGSIYGGDPVTVTGTNLADGTVTFGLEPASATCSATSCTVTTPRNGAGTIDVRVATGGGTTARSAADEFTYTAPALTPTSVAVGASADHVAAGDPVTLTAVVGPSDVEGKVQFKNGWATLGDPILVTNGQAQTTVSHLPSGSQTVTAEFTPSDLQTYAASTGSTTVRVGADPSVLGIGRSRTIAYGSSTTVTAHLTDTSTSTGIDGASITLWKRPSSTATWSKVLTRTTSGGYASATQKPTAYTQYQWRYAGNSLHKTASSSSETVSVAQVVAVKVTRTRAHVGNVVKIYGTVKPSGSGKVFLQRKSGTRWVSLTSVSLKRQRLPDGRTVVGYVFGVTMTKKGTFTYRAYRPKTSRLASGYSGAVTIRVS